MSWLSDKQKNEYRAAFRLFDKDKDGFISNDELITVMRSIGQQVSQVELRELFCAGGDYTQARYLSPSWPAVTAPSLCCRCGAAGREDRLRHVLQPDGQLPCPS